ncbi:MAG: hypothetical protein ACTS5I_13865, partial [Rhodanobacter sp.]
MELFGLIAGISKGHQEFADEVLSLAKVGVGQTGDKLAANVVILSGTIRIIEGRIFIAGDFAIRLPLGCDVDSRVNRKLQ